MKTARRPDIEIVRGDDCAWTVYELAVSDPPSQRVLVFMSDRIARRVRHYSPNWFELADEALAELGTRV
jgi:hypothetical protein